MTTTPQVSIQTVDSTGNLDEMPLETLLELLVVKLPAPAAPPPVLPNAVEKVKHIPPGATGTANLDEASAFYLLVKKGQPCALSLVSSASKHDKPSSAITVFAEDALTLPDVAFWGGGKPDIKGFGELTVSRMRILEAGQERIVWRASWLPWVAV